MLIDDVERQAAHLRAHSAVRAAACGHISYLAVAAVAHASRAVDKHFGRHTGGIDGFPDAGGVEFAWEHQACESCLCQPSGFPGSAYVALSGGVQCHRQIHVQIGHVLHDESIDSCIA